MWKRFLPERSNTMTDWDLMVEYIQRAMDAVDKAHEVTSELRENATPEALDQFRIEIDELTEHLVKLQTVLNNQEAFALDELADWLSEAFTGNPSDYRRTSRMIRSLTVQWSYYLAS